MASTMQFSLEGELLRQGDELTVSFEGTQPIKVGRVQLLRSTEKRDIVAIPTDFGKLIVTYPGRNTVKFTLGNLKMVGRWEDLLNFLF